MHGYPYTINPTYAAPYRSSNEEAVRLAAVTICGQLPSVESWSHLIDWDDGVVRFMGFCLRDTYYDGADWDLTVSVPLRKPDDAWVRYWSDERGQFVSGEHVPVLREIRDSIVRMWLLLS